jgi:hypothetical protein
MPPTWIDGEQLELAGFLAPDAIRMGGA